MKHLLALALSLAALSANAEQRAVFLQDNTGARIQIATLEVDAIGGYGVQMAAEPFADHFLSMRPFRCLEGPEKHWCHVPYPYEIERNIANEATDLEYDFLFVWKGRTDYGINMWNGVYYKIGDVQGQLVGVLHEMDMDILSAPPAPGELRPVRASDLHQSAPESHWLPVLVIE